MVIKDLMIYGNLIFSNGPTFQLVQIFYQKYVQDMLCLLIKIN